MQFPQITEISQPTYSVSGHHRPTSETPNSDGDPHLGVYWMVIIYHLIFDGNRNLIFDGNWDGNREYLN